jgi:transcriptional regulator with XRE-family HTH domain
MDSLNHWTEASVDDYMYRIAFDYIGQIEKAMEKDGVNQAVLAQRLGVSEGRVSQLLNNPGNLTLRKMIEYARALKKKVSLLPYDDGDLNNQRGPIPSEIFVSCWELAGRPTDFFELEEQSTSRNPSIILMTTTNASTRMASFERVGTVCETASTGEKHHGTADTNNI